MTRPLYVGLDLGGTNIKGAVTTAEAQSLADETVPTLAQAGPEAVMSQMDDLARRLVAQAGAEWRDVAAVGIGVAAWLDYDAGLILQAANLAGWVDIPLREQMSQRLGKPVVVENDANAAAWGEYVAGAGRGAHSMALLTLGTGIGGGIIVHDRLLRGHSDTAGELGHTMIRDDGPECVCGNRGCLEAFASAPATVQRFIEAVRGGADSALAEKVRAGEAVTTEDIYQQAMAGDTLCRQTLQETARFLGIGVHNIIMAVNPQRIVLAGGMIAAGDLIMETVKAVVAERTLPYAARYTEIGRGQLGEIAGAIGAAGCAAREYPPAIR